MVTNTKFSLRACAAAVALLCLGTGAARAADAVLLNPLFQDHAVLQRDRADPVWGRAKPGTAVTVTLPDNSRYNGQVRLVAPSVDANTKLGKVRVRLPVSRALRPGGFGRAQFSGSGTPVLAVPETAVRQDADGVSVMVVDPSNQYKWVAVSGRGEMTEEGADASIDHLAKKYLDADSYPYRTPEETRVIVRIAPEKVDSSGFEG